MKTSFAAPSQWWTVARVLVIISAVLSSLVAVGLLLGGFAMLALVHGAGGAVGGGAMIFFGLGFGVVSALYWWAVVALHHGSNTARWILGVLAGIGVLSAFTSLLHTGGLSVLPMLYDGLICYGLLLDPSVRAAFANGSISNMSMGANSWGAGPPPNDGSNNDWPT